MIRIGNAQGFWGDWLDAPVRMVEDGPLDYLTLDYLAEVTMSILHKQRQKDPALGYARDFPPLMARLAPTLLRRGVRVIANAGGVNPVACAREVRRLAPDLRVAVVLGDDVFDRIDEFLAKGYALENLDTGEPLSAIRGRITSANAYTGAFPVAAALASGAQVVVTGRCADPALTLAPLIHEFGWRADEHDKLAAGVVAGHIIECGPQATGGNCQADWESIPDLARIGYPVVEFDPGGSFVVTKHAGTGGRVDPHVVKEQLVYELGDPKRFLTPDCSADFTTIRLTADGADRVRIDGVRGGPPTPFLKLSISYHYGWKAIGTLTFSWPGALNKARAADAIVRARLATLGLTFESVQSEYLGAGALHAHLAAPVDDPPEVQLRVGVRGPDRGAVDRFTRELIPLVLSGPPGATGYGEGRPPVREIVAYWPALLPREEISHQIDVV